MEDYLNKVKALVSEAMQAARDEGEKTATAAYAKNLEALKLELEGEYAVKLEKEKSAAFELGRVAALKELELQEPEPAEPQGPAAPDVLEIEMLEVEAAVSELKHVPGDDFARMDADINTKYAVEV